MGTTGEVLRSWALGPIFLLFSVFPFASLTDMYL